MKGSVQITGWVVNWAMWTQHNPRVPSGVIDIISKGSYLKSSLLSKIFYLGLSFFSIYQHYWTVLNWSWKLERHQIGAWNRCCLWPLKHTKKLLVTKQEPPELYTHLNQCVELLLRQLEAEFKICFEWSFLGKKLYLGLIWGNIACYRKYQCNK